MVECRDFPRRASMVYTRACPPSRIASGMAFKAASPILIKARKSKNKLNPWLALSMVNEIIMSGPTKF